MGVHRKTGVFLQIPDLGQAVPVFEGQLGKHVAGKGKKRPVEAVRLFQFYHQALEKLLPRRKVFRPGMGVHRETGVFLQIPDLGQAVPVFEGQLGKHVAGKGKKRPVEAVRLLYLPLELAGVKLGVEYHIDKTA
jgi:predicted alpha/beta hydrolase